MPSRGALGAAVLTVCAGAAAAQQPELEILPLAYSRTLTNAPLSWSAHGPAGDLFVLVADTTPGPAPLLGAVFDLGLTPAAFVLDAGVLLPAGNHGITMFAPSSLPPSEIYFQFAHWNPAVGFPPLGASTNATAIVHDHAAAVTLEFDWFTLLTVTGTFDRSVTHRLQASAPSVRTVRPTPVPAQPFLVQSALQPLHPSGSRFQTVLRAADLGSTGAPELLTAVRWRPLFGIVNAESFPQFELRAAHSDVVPDYSIDPWSALPVAPASGLETTFAANPVGLVTLLHSGPYAVSPQALTASGYVPYPAPAQSFVWDGQRSLLIETLCPPVPGGGLPANQHVLQLMVPSSANPFGTVAAAAGVHGLPSPIVPATTTTGTGGSYVLDLELEFQRMTSIATSSWLPANVTSPDYQSPQATASVPPGTSLGLEFRGALDQAGTGATAWSTTPDVADGLPFLQVRITMDADPVTGAVPWIDGLVVPAL